MRGPGTRAMVEVDCVTPSMLPCSFVEVRFDMKLGTTVRKIPLLADIIVRDNRKMMMFGRVGIRIIPRVINNGPKAINFSSLMR